MKGPQKRPRNIEQEAGRIIGNMVNQSYLAKIAKLEAKLAKQKVYIEELESIANDDDDVHVCYFCARLTCGHRDYCHGCFLVTLTECVTCETNINRWRPKCATCKKRRICQDCACKERACTTCVNKSKKQ